MGQTLKVQASSYYNQNLIINIIPNHLKIPSGNFGPLNHFLDPNPDYRDIFLAAKIFPDFGYHKSLGHQTLGWKYLMSLLNLQLLLFNFRPQMYRLQNVFPYDLYHLYYLYGLPIFYFLSIIQINDRTYRNLFLIFIFGCLEFRTTLKSESNQIT